MKRWRKGADSTEMKLSQWANDWVSSTDGQILNPTTLEFTDEERARIDTADDSHVGMFWRRYEWKSPTVNRLVKRKRTA